MTTEFNRYLEQLRELELAAPEILDASRKIAIYDKYISEGGSDSETRDYFEVQRLLETFGDSAEIIPPKTPLRSDYELLSEAIAYYLRAKNEYRVNVEYLKGFLLPDTVSEGDIKQIGAVVCEDGGRLIATNQGESIISFSDLKSEIMSKMGENPLEKFKDIFGDVSEDEEMENELEDGVSLADQLVARYRRGGLANNQSDSAITNLRELRSFLFESLTRGNGNTVSDDEVEEVIGLLGSV